ncbi:MAG: VOC family protein [Tessaracoccus sp.]
MTISIDHVAIFVRDLEAMRTFYETYFGATSNEEYHNPRTGLRTYFLSFDGTSRLELMTRPDKHTARGTDDIGWAHTAFSLGSAEAVDRLAQRLREDGFSVTDPRTTGDGYYEAVVIDPEGNQIEITV